MIKNLKPLKLFITVGILLFIFSLNSLASEKNLAKEKNKSKLSYNLIMKGTKFETELYIIEGVEDGPTIWINGGTHGDEKAGYIAAEKMLSYDLKKGKLIILPRMNKLACEADKRTTSFMNDLNRAFPGKKEGGITEKLAYSITEKIKEHKPQIIIDLHESRGSYKEGKLGNSIIFSKNSNTADLVMNLILDINSLAKDEDEIFTFFSNPPKGSLNNEIPKILNIPVLTLETNRKLPINSRVRQQLNIIEKILNYY
jgi:predicted deacylase